VGKAERQNFTLKTAGVKSNYCGYDAECLVRRYFRGHRRKPTRNVTFSHPTTQVAEDMMREDREFLDFNAAVDALQKRQAEFQAANPPSAIPLLVLTKIDKFVALC
jgi:hypothetical protein